MGDHSDGDIDNVGECPITSALLMSISRCIQNIYDYFCSVLHGKCIELICFASYDFKFYIILQ